MIPFNRPYVSGNEMRYMAEACERGHISGDGVFTRRCQQMLEEALGVPKALLTTSCTDALEMVALLLDLQPGDEVIVPSFTFVSTANAFVLRGAVPRFCDIDPVTLNLDPNQLRALLTPRTRAVVVVHYAGVACEMDEIARITEQAGVALVEDNAHGLFGTYRGRPLGTFGQFAALSFHETKNFSCGEGGALLINDRRFIARAEILREKGTDRSRFFRGEVDKYSWVDVGSSFLPSDLLGAHLCAQLESRVDIQQRRSAIWNFYSDALRGWAAGNGVTLPVIPADRAQSFHLFYAILPDEPGRDRFIAELRRLGVYAVFHYQPLHLSAMGRRFGGAEGDCPVTERISARVVRLPFFTGMTAAESAHVVEAVQSFRV